MHGPLTDLETIERMEKELEEQQPCKFEVLLYCKNGQALFGVVNDILMLLR